MLYLSLMIFIATYVGLLVFPNKRPQTAVISMVIFLLLGVLPIQDALGAIDWNVILMLFGIMGIVELFIESQMPLYLADIILEKSSNVRMTIIYLAAFSGIISAFVDNVATVLILIPIAFSICKRINISPVAPIITLSIASNLQGAATLVGDATAILLGSHLNMSFFDFFFYHGKLSIFWSVQIAFIVFLMILFVMYRKETNPVTIDEDIVKVTVSKYYPTYLLVSAIILLIGFSFVENKPQITNGLICIVLFFIGIFMEMIRKNNPLSMLKKIDYQTLVILSSLFVIIAAISSTGVIDLIGDLFISLGGNNTFVIYTLITFFSVVIAAFIDNIPYVAMMLPVIGVISSGMNIEPTLLYFGLLTGATIGGNLTPIGASANITSIGMLRKNDYKVNLMEYLKISIPTTLIPVFVSYLIVWFIWS